MENNELDEARKNPEFLKFLETKEKEVIENKDIKGLYEVLDNLLILDLEETRINNVYEMILKVAFDDMESQLNSARKIPIENSGIYYVRAFYEHAIEKWSHSNFEGAKQLFFILSNIIEDELLKDTMNVHLIACAKNLDMDTFYDKQVSQTQMQEDEVYGYFIMNFNFNSKEYIKENSKLLDSLSNELNGLLE